MAEALLHVLLRWSVELSLALLGVMALRPLLRRGFGAGSAYRVWLLVPLLLAVAHLPASRPGQILHQLVIADAPPALATLPIEDTGIEPLAVAVLVLWIVGAAAVLAVLAHRQGRFIAGLRFDAQALRWQGPAGSGPALVGWLPPRLCLPQDFAERYTPAQQALILAHEDVHRRRADNAWNLLTAAVCALQWFNPLAWLAARALRADQELSCDEIVLRRHPDQATDYARALLQAQGFPAAQGLPWASWRSSHPLVERIAMLKIHAHARRRAGWGALLCLGLLGGGAVHAVQSDQLVKPKPADVKLDISLEYSEKKDGHLDTWQVSTSVAVPNNAETHVLLPLHAAGVSGDDIELIASAAPTGTGPIQAWMVSSEIHKGTPAKVLGKPRLITADGARGTIEIAYQIGDTVDQKVRIAITPTSLHPQAQAQP